MLPYSMRTKTGAEADPPANLSIEPEPVKRTWTAPSGYAAEANCPVLRLRLRLICNGNYAGFRQGDARLARNGAVDTLVMSGSSCPANYLKAAGRA
jgi:hypothetical protein